MADEGNLRLQLLEERREADAANAKRDERMSVLEAKFENLRTSNRVLVGAFATLATGTIGSAVAIILTTGGG